MISYQKEISELTTLAKLLLQQEHESNEWLVTDNAFYDDMRNWVTAAPPIKKTEARTPAQALPPLPPAKPSLTPARQQLAAKRTPPTAQKKEISSQDDSAAFSLSPLPAAAVDTFEDIKSLMKEACPHVPYIETPLDDAIAKDTQDNSTAPSLLLLTTREGPEEQEFLSNVATVVSHYLKPAQVWPAFKFEHEASWDAVLRSKELKLIIVSESSLNALPALRQQHAISASSKQHYLGPVPLFLIPNCSSFFHNPRLKAQLWNALKQFFSAKK
jgi:hypothetical protein